MRKLGIQDRHNRLTKAVFRDFAEAAEEERLGAIKREVQRYEATVFVIVSLAFTFAVSSAAEPFCCDRETNGTRWYMRSDASIPCVAYNGDTDEWEQDMSDSQLDEIKNWFYLTTTSISLIASFSILVYFLFTKLYKADQAQVRGERGEFRIRYGWLYARYDEGFWYWEFIIMMRKLVFVAIAVLPQQQLVWVLYFLGTLTALAAQIHLRPFADRDVDANEHMRVQRNPRNWREWLAGKLRARILLTSAGGPANLAESRNLLVQSVTVGLGGLFVFGIVDEANPSTPGYAIGVFVVVINFLTLIPALRLVYGMLKQRCRNANDATAPLLGAGSPQQTAVLEPEPGPEPELEPERPPEIGGSE